MKRAYETVLILDAMLPDEQLDSTVKEIEKYLGENATDVKSERRGKRHMAYDINGKSHGDYTVFNFSAEGATVTEFERKLKFNEANIRFLTVLKE